MMVDRPPEISNLDGFMRHLEEATHSLERASSNTSPEMKRQVINHLNHILQNFNDVCEENPFLLTGQRKFTQQEMKVTIENALKAVFHFQQRHPEEHWQANVM